MTPHSDSGIIDERSQHSVEQTVERLTALLHAKGVTLFALVDHSAEAATVGMTMPPTKLLIFGTPRAGTPLMLAAPSVAIDLPACPKRCCQTSPSWRRWRVQPVNRQASSPPQCPD